MPKAFQSRAFAVIITTSDPNRKYSAMRYTDTVSPAALAFAMACAPTCPTGATPCAPSYVVQPFDSGSDERTCSSSRNTNAAASAKYSPKSQM